MLRSEVDFPDLVHPQVSHGLHWFGERRDRVRQHNGLKQVVALLVKEPGLFFVEVINFFKEKSAEPFGLIVEI